MRKRAGKVITLAVIILLLPLYLKVGFEANYQRQDLPVEMLFFPQASIEGCF